MNDFYGPRRTIIADVAGLVGMALAGMASSALVWDTLASGFKTGRLERAFAVFLAVVLTAAAVGGLAGLAFGRRLGAAWERRHRAHRPPPGADQPAAPTERAATRAPDPGVPSRAVPGLRLAPLGADVASLISLLQRASVPDELHSADVLRRSASLGAWDGARLVGVVRFVTDGRAGTVRALVVDPAWRRRGLGRELVREAQAASGGGVLTFAEVPAGAVAFVRSLGAAPAPAAWRLAPPPVSAPGA